MTFTFAASLSTDISLVRFHIGDTRDEGHYLDDETIQYFITAGSVSSAVIACIRYIITQLSQPDFRLDWMTVSNAEARKGFENLLKQKAQELGVSASGAVATSTISHAHRADSDENVDGVYDAPDGTP
jgi:hypothetical protein